MTDAFDDSCSISSLMTESDNFDAIK